VAGPDLDRTLDSLTTQVLKLDNNSTTTMAPTTARRNTIATRTLKTSRKGKEKETRAGKVTRLASFRL
jgi:hypothetical protein